MSHERFERAILWYASRGLDETDTREVESHLAFCAGCRDALEEIRAIGCAASAPRPADDLLDHPPASMLWDLATRAVSLSEPSTMWLREHMDGCDACAGTQPVLRELSRRQSSRGRVARFREALSSTVLRPIPALACLVALLVVVPAILLLRAPATPGEDVQILSPALPVSGEVDLRAPGGAQAAPLPVAPPPAGPLHLELRMELDPLLIEDPGVALRLEIRRGAAVVHSHIVDRSAFDARGSLHVLIDRALVQAGSTMEILLRIEAPGDDLDGTAVFRRSLAVRAGGG